jgi:signal peptidase I
MLFKNQSKPKVQKNSLQVLSEYVQALVGAVVLAILIRGFVFEPFVIPSESMVPTLLIGDHIFVLRYQYGLRVPFTKIWLHEFGDPKRGDVVVFSYPEDEDIDFIKRVIGIPGDHVTMRDGVLSVNDKPLVHQAFYPEKPSDHNACTLSLTAESENLLSDGFKEFPFYRRYKKFTHSMETLDNGVVHMIQMSKDEPNDFDFDVTVPERSYFVMGDNRDQSQDSRFWGFVPRENLKGKAVRIWLSVNKEKTVCPYNLDLPDWVPWPMVRWDRFGRQIL